MGKDISLNAVKKKSLFQEAMGRFFRIKTAVFGMAVIVVIVSVCLLAGIICPEGYDAQNIGSRFLSPGSGGLLGTDDLGRSMLARVLYGGRISLSSSIWIYGPFPDIWNGSGGCCRVLPGKSG